MEHAIWVIGGDVRLHWATRYLACEGWEVHTHHVPEEPSEPLPERLSLVLLPFPSVQGALIRGHSGIPMEEAVCRLASESCVFGGLLGEWKEILTEKNVRLYDLYGVEPFTTENALITAECALQLAMERSPLTLFGSSCLVIGFGRIGKLLAQKLKALGAEVTVAARKEADHGLIAALGYGFEQTGSYQRLDKYDFLFNTVPAAVLSESQLAQLPSHCLLLELASQPGGFSLPACEALGLQVCSASGLPGRYAPKSAGILYAKTILSILNQEVIP